MVPEDVVQKTQKTKPKVAVQANGLPEGVKILAVAGAPDPTTITPKTSDTPVAAPEIPETKVPPKSKPELKPKSEEKPEIELDHSLIHARTRIAPPEPKLAPDAPAPLSEASITLKTPAPKKRKAGRPKAGRLDVPRTIASQVSVNLPSAPRIAPVTPVAPSPPVAPPASAPAPIGPRRMSDIAPRRHPRHSQEATVQPTAAKTAPAEAKAPAKPAKRTRPMAHKVGVPAIHYAPVIAFSMRARARPRLVALAALGAISIGAACAYGVWMLTTKSVTGLASGLMQAGPKLIIEAGLLGVVYYIGRSLGQTAITYGIAREADARPVTLSRQLGIAINTFGRRLVLDIGYGLMELSVLVVGAVLFLTGGETWPIDANLQIGLIFSAYLVLLYALVALTLSRGLAGVNIALTNHRPTVAAKTGWKLFSHRIELIGPRFGALALELLLAVPLVALGIAFVVAAPPELHLLVTIGVGILAWLAGALFGVGTAAWWTMLYRQLVLTDRPGAEVALLSSRQPEDARRAPLALIVAFGTLVLTVTVILPWLKLG